jgi:hypothetical protein
VATYTVTKVRKEWAPDGKPRHLEGVITDGGIHYTRKEIADSIDRGHSWKTSSGGYSATISKVTYCPHGSCVASPYIRTNPDSTKQDNLENLPEG